MREVALEGRRGRLLLTSMPGRWEPFEETLVELLACSRVIVLTPDAEIAEKSPRYLAWLQTREPSSPPRVVRFPIGDYGVPDDRDAYAALVRETAEAIVGGEAVVVHCAAGVGRTGTFAVCVMLELGYPRTAAVETIKALGSGPETPEQAELVDTIERRVLR